MLEYLRIRNLALIEDVELEFAPGLNVLTGETGAGKSFILRALNFLLGDKLGTDLVRPGKDKAQVEALFRPAGEDILLKRELSADTGRSRLFLNDSLSSQEAVKELRPGLLIHVSQHGQQRLLQPAYQGKLVDEFLEDKSLLTQRDRLLKELRARVQEREDCEKRCSELQSRREFLEYQLQEIEKIAPKPNEEEELEARRRDLRDMEGARQNTEEALELLRGAEPGLIPGMERLGALLQSLSKFRPDLAETIKRMEEAAIELRELEAGLRKNDASLSADQELESIEGRLWALTQLRRKLHRSLDEILDMRSEITENLSFLDSSLLDLKRLDKDIEDLREELNLILLNLNKARETASEVFSSRLTSDLKGLGFSEHVRTLVELTPQEIHPGLVELRPHILWAPNPGQPPQPLDKIASGGELSRFLLAVVGLQAQKDQPSLIFDEVDAGVGGLTLNRLAERLADLAGRQQVVLITHWPQLASQAGRHFLISKDVIDGETYTSCTRLDKPAIAEELARMAGGGDQGRRLTQGLLLPQR